MGPSCPPGSSPHSAIPQHSCWGRRAQSLASAGAKEGISLEATSLLPPLDPLLSHLNPCPFLRAILCLCNPCHTLGASMVCGETVTCPEGVLVSAEALSHLPEDGRARAEASFSVLGLYLSLPTGGSPSSEFSHSLTVDQYVQSLVTPWLYPECGLVCVEPRHIPVGGWCVLDPEPLQATQVCGGQGPAHCTPTLEL